MMNRQRRLDDTQERDGSRVRASGEDAMTGSFEDYQIDGYIWLSFVATEILRTPGGSSFSTLCLKSVGLGLL